MLNSIRNKTKGWVAYTIIALIIVPFALFGIAEYSTNTSNIVIATVDGDEIAQIDFLPRFNQQKRLAQQRLGDNYSPEFNNQLKQSTVQTMINEHLLDKLAEKLGHATTDLELQNIVHANEEFQVDGIFSLEKYQQLLRLNGYSPVEYETLKLNELTQRQIKQNLADSAFVGDLALKNLQNLNSQQRQFNYIRLNTKDYFGQVSVKDKQIEDFYNAEKASFFEPEKISLDFIELSLTEIAKKIQVNDDDLRNFYEQEKQRFATEEERRAQHILLENEDEAKAILAQLQADGDFIKLAKEHSKDTGSKGYGGDLGFFARGVMVAEFEKTVFAMEENQLSDLVKSEFGYHIIKLNEIKPGTQKSFAEVKAELSDLYTQEKAKIQLYDLTEQLANLAYEASLEEAANQMNLELKSTELFDRNDTKLPKKMLAAAFSDEVFNKNENSPVLELSKDKFAVVRLLQKIPQRQKDFSEVKTQIKKRLSAAAAKEFISKITTNIASLLQKNDKKAAEKIIKKHKLKWQKIGWVKRNSDKAEGIIIEKIFTLPKPTAGKATYNSRDFDENYSVVVELLAVKESTPDEKAAVALRRTLLAIEADELFQAILITLRRQAELKIFTNRL
ncbi:MAG: peptidylprolyl isomerase [Candidatus Thioglobus sp.]|nr:peptidylprolyl isomerase [Candidatus Thioglobus sp.]